MSEENKYEEVPLENGLQPLDGLMESLGMNNHDIVEFYEGQLTHKTVMKARKGRKIARKLQLKVLQAFNAKLLDLDPEQESKKREDLFNYGH